MELKTRVLKFLCKQIPSEIMRRVYVERLLAEASVLKAKYEVQFAKGEENSWTEAEVLNEEGLKRLSDDFSVSKVRVEIEL